MKQLTSLLIICLFTIFSAQSQTKDMEIKELTAAFLKVNEGDLNPNTPISSLNKLALNQAAKSITLTKDNIVSSLNEAKNYKWCIITVGTHTIVKISDLNKTITSGSWGCKMPYGVGYVQKGSMNKKEDFINNIIGIPDTQRRMMFLFN